MAKKFDDILSQHTETVVIRNRTENTQSVLAPSLMTHFIPPGDTLQIAGEGDTLVYDLVDKLPEGAGEWRVCFGITAKLIQTIPTKFLLE